MAGVPITPQPDMNTRRLPILARHAISLAVIFAVALPLSYLIGTRVYRHLELGKLENQDAEVFQEGMVFVLTHAASDAVVQHESLEKVRRLDAKRSGDLLLTVATSYSTAGRRAPDRVLTEAGELIHRMSVAQAVGLYDSLLATGTLEPAALSRALLEKLSPSEEAELYFAVELLEARLLWSREQVPIPLWVRWLTQLAGDSDEVAQQKAARLLGELPDEVNDPRIAASLDQLSVSSHAIVRAEVLKASAGYAAIATDPTDYEQIIFRLGGDTNPVIARHAWMAVGHLKPASGYAVDWKRAETSVAEAMLWAAAKTSPENPDAVLQAYENEETRKLSRYALAELDDDASVSRLETIVGTHEDEKIEIDPGRLIGLINASADLDPEFLAITCVSVMSNPAQANELAVKLVRMPQPLAQKLGVLISGILKLKPALIYGDYKPLLKAQPDVTSEQIHAMTDEELAGFGLRRVDAINSLLDAAESASFSAKRRTTIKIFKLALWMRGDLGDDFTPAAEAMLYDEDLPISTVLMCLLHMKRSIALAYLFGDEADVPVNLNELFIQQRFWHVFRRFVDTTNLKLWLWGDNDAQAFQFEAMRQWYAVNRWKIDRGWWPEINADG